MMHEFSNIQIFHDDTEAEMSPVIFKEEEFNSVFLF